MVTEEELHRICMALPEALAEHPFGVLNKGKLRGFTWMWNERVEMKKPKVPNPEVYAVRTVSLEDKELLLAQMPHCLFTEPHYNGYPAVLVQLADIDLQEMCELLVEGWMALAPKPLAKQWSRDALMQRMLVSVSKNQGDAE